MSNDGNTNIFKKLKDKFKLAVKNMNMDINNLPNGIREQCIELEEYRNVLRDLYLDLLRVLNGNPAYDPTCRKEDPYYVEKDSPGEQFSECVQKLGQLMWNGNFPRYCVRLGYKISEIEKVLQRDANQQLFHIHNFLIKEYPKFEKIRTDCLEAKNKYEVLEDRKKIKAKGEYEHHLQKVQKFLSIKVPEAKKKHIHCLLYFMRCYHRYHVSLYACYAGTTTVKVLRPGSQRD